MSSARLMSLASGRTRNIVLAVAATCFATTARADCDFGKQVGTCAGRVTVLRTGGSAPSYSADVKIFSSARTCSKVEYYVDSTPYQTILRNSGEERESLFGSKPIGQQSIQYSTCKVYAAVPNKGMSPGSERPESSAPGIAGHWSGQVSWFIFSSPTTIDVAVNGSTARGTWTDGKSGVTVPFVGSLEGNTLLFNYTAVGDGSHGTATMALTGPHTASVSFKAPAATFSGTLTRQP